MLSSLPRTSRACRTCFARVDDGRVFRGLPALQRRVAVVEGDAIELEQTRDAAEAYRLALARHGRLCTPAILETLARPLMKWLCANWRPHVTVVVTPTSAELLEGLVSTGEVADYVQD